MVQVRDEYSLLPGRRGVQSRKGREKQVGVGNMSEVELTELADGLESRG